MNSQAGGNLDFIENANLFSGKWRKEVRRMWTRIEGENMNSKLKISCLFQIIILPALLLSAVAINTSSAEIIPQDRRVDWSQAGIIFQA